MRMLHVGRHFDRARRRVAATGFAGLVAAAIAAGCGDKPTAPVGSAFPSFALTDVNPHTPTSEQVLTQTWLTGPAAVVYFGWAT